MLTPLRHTLPYAAFRRDTLLMPLLFRLSPRMPHDDASAILRATLFSSFDYIRYVSYATDSYKIHAMLRFMPCHCRCHIPCHYAISQD